MSKKTFAFYYCSFNCLNCCLSNSIILQLFLTLTLVMGVLQLRLLGFVCSFAGCDGDETKQRVSSQRLYVEQISIQLQKSRLIFKRLLPKIHINHVGALPSLLYAFKHLMNVMYKSLAEERLW